MKTLYYRGSLRSCNYTCGYCPFHKSSDIDSIETDRLNLEKFRAAVSSISGPLNVMLVPYGEALIHDYYLETLSVMSGYENIRTVGAQTNLSFSVEKLNQFIERYGNREKIRLWCSFHPSQTKTKDFLNQCQLLIDYKIKYSVGAVGDIKNITAINEIRKSLPEDINIWVNKADGLKTVYTQSEINSFTQIDPMYKLEITARKADFSKCTAGKHSFFIESDGGIYSCNLSKVKLGNLFDNPKIIENSEARNACRSKYCGCYLAYSNRTDIEELTHFKDRVFRIY